MPSVRVLALALISATCLLTSYAADVEQTRPGSSVKGLIGRLVQNLAIAQPDSPSEDYSASRQEESTTDGSGTEYKKFPFAHLDLGKRQNGSSKPTSSSLQPTGSRGKDPANAPAETAMSQSTTANPPHVPPTSESTKVPITSGAFPTTPTKSTKFVTTLSTTTKNVQTTVPAKTTTKQKTTDYDPSTTIITSSTSTRYRDTTTTVPYPSDTDTTATTTRTRPSRSYTNPLVSGTTSTTRTTPTSSTPSTSSTSSTSYSTSPTSVPVRTITKTSTADNGSQIVITSTHTRTAATAQGQGNGDGTATSPEAQLQTGGTVSSKEGVANWAMGAGAIALAFGGLV